MVRPAVAERRQGPDQALPPPLEPPPTTPPRPIEAASPESPATAAMEGPPAGRPLLGIWGMARFGQRLALCVGLALFALGNLLCGAAIDVPTMSAAKVVEGLGKGIAIVIGRSLLYASSTAR
jgi:hypothetical protein